MRNNNFNLIRFVAALQVVIVHSMEHLQLEEVPYLNVLNQFLRFFPGVPIFFFISGFLIYGSLERTNSNLIQYCINRALRIFPALWVCFGVTLIFILLSTNGGIQVGIKEGIIWTFSQLSFAQFYTPDSLRFWGIGTPNGSLWTIPVELQFYIVLPFLYYFFKSKKWFWPAFALVLTASIVSNIIIGSHREFHDDLISKFGAVFVLPYLYYFLIGVLVKKYWKTVHTYVQNKFVVWIVVYLAFSTIFHFGFHIDTSSYWIKTPLNILATIILAGVTFSLSFSFKGLSAFLLKDFDISYGIYIYHMLIVNVLVQLKLMNNIYGLIVTLIATLVLATLSWIYIEKPSLGRKELVFQYVAMKLNSKKNLLA